MNEKFDFSLDEFREIGGKNLLKIVYAELSALQKENWLPADRERKSRIISNLVRTRLMLEKGFTDDKFSNFMQFCEDENEQLPKETFSEPDAPAT
jgi:hypothetical protein